MTRAEIVETLRGIESGMRTTNQLRAEQLGKVTSELESTALPPNPTVRDIVRNYLESGGYDGLYSDDGCGCSTGDFVPCSCCDIELCQVGYRQHHTSDSAAECGGIDCHCIGPEKPTEETNVSLD